MRAAGSPLGCGKVRVDDVSALGVGLVGPVAEGRLHRAADLGLGRAVGAERHHGLLEAPQDHVAHEVLPVLLRCVDDVVALAGHAWLSREVLYVRKQASPLGLQEVDDVQVLGLRLEVAALRREEMHVRVAGVPAALVHVDPALETQLKVALAGSDVDLGAERVVLVATRDVHDDLAPGEPALGRAVDVGVADLSETQVAANVDVPGIEVGVDLVVVAVRLVRHAVGRSEVDAGRDGLPGLVVHDTDAHPVLARLDQLDAHPFGIDGAAALDVSPLHAVDLLSPLGHLNRRGGNAGQLDVGRAGFRVLRLPESPLRVGQEVVGRLLGKRVDVGALAAVDGDIEVEGLLGALRVLEADPHGTAGVARERVLIDVSERDARDDEAWTPGHELDGLDDAVGRRIAPCPQPVPCGLRLNGLRLAPPYQIEASLVAGHEGVFLVGHRKVGEPYPESRYPLTIANDADLVPLTYGHGDGLRVHEPDYVVRDVDPDGTVGVLLGLHLPVCEDDSVRGLADRHRSPTHRPPPARRSISRKGRRRARRR